MKLLFVSHVTSLYGANFSLIRLINGLKKYDVSSVVAFPIQEEQEGMKKFLRILAENDIRGFPAHGICYDDDFVKWAHEKPVSDWHISTFAREFRPDIIYTNTSVISIGAVVADYLKIPHVWHLREFRDMHFKSSREYIDLANGHFHKYLRKSGAVIANSNSMADYPLYQVNKKISVIYNGIFSQKQPLPEKAVVNNGVTFCLVGLLSPRKNIARYSKRQDVAIKAFARVNKVFPDTRLLVVGDGRGLHEYKNLTRSLMLADKVEFSGYTSDIQSIYEKTDVLLSCANKEAFGNTIVEAMHFGLPVIAHGQGGPVEIVKPGTGFLYSDFPELVKHMSYFAQHPEKVIEMGKNAQRRVRDDFTIEKYAAEVYELLKEVNSGAGQGEAPPPPPPPITGADVDVADCCAGNGCAETPSGPRGSCAPASTRIRRASA